LSASDTPDIRLQGALITFGIQKKVVVVMMEKTMASVTFSQFYLIYFLRSRPKFELTITKMPPRTPQMAPTMIELGITSIVGGEMSRVPNLRTDP
jgi:hypothetical protein